MMIRHALTARDPRKAEAQLRIMIERCKEYLFYPDSLVSKDFLGLHQILDLTPPEP